MCGPGARLDQCRTAAGGNPHSLVVSDCKGRVLQITSGKARLPVRILFCQPEAEGALQGRVPTQLTWAGPLQAPASTTPTTSSTRSPSTPKPRTSPICLQRARALGERLQKGSQKSLMRRPATPEPAPVSGLRDPPAFQFPQLPRTTSGR